MVSPPESLRAPVASVVNGALGVARGVGRQLSSVAARAPIPGRPPAAVTAPQRPESPQPAADDAGSAPDEGPALDGPALEGPALEGPALVTPAVVGPTDGPAAPDTVEALSAPRLARHTFVMADGRRVGVAVAGRGVPLVVVHGFTAEGFLYAQTLHRLVSTGFKVVAIDLAGHGGSQGLPRGFGRLGDYAELLSRCLDELGITSAVLAGHSMGGRVVAQLAARHPDQAVAVLLIDAIVGDEWDALVNVARVFPPVLGVLGAAMAVDAASTLPVLTNPAQAAKLGRLAIPNYVVNVLAPWRLAGGAFAILASRGSRSILAALADAGTPTVVLTGTRDPVVPPRTARSAARRANAQLVEIAGAGHSWLLRDPETLPAVVTELLDGELGAAIRARLHAGGAGDLETLEAQFYAPGALIVAMTPVSGAQDVDSVHHRPRYRWSVSRPASN